MIGVLVETVVVAFIMGGIIGAITALHLASQQKTGEQKVPARVNNNQKTPDRH